MIVCDFRTKKCLISGTVIEKTVPLLAKAQLEDKNISRRHQNHLHAYEKPEHAATNKADFQVTDTKPVGQPCH